MKTTKSAKPHEVEKKWHIVDATDLVVGRAAVGANGSRLAGIVVSTSLTGTEEGTS